ncbi:10460_t:CDS:1, partial [Scutellospora calospora]
NLNNIQFENEQTIHQDSIIQNNLKRKFSNLDNKSESKLHEIHKKFYINLEETKLIYKIYEQSYTINITTTNLKKHFEKNHKEKYIEILNNQSLIQQQTNN